MLLTALNYSLGALSGVLSAAGALWLFWRLTPRPLDQEALRDALTDLADLKLAFAGFADQYELAYIRNAAKLGKLRRQIAKLRDEDIIEDDGDEAPADGVVTLPPATAAGAGRVPSKADLWRTREVKP